MSPLRSSRLIIGCSLKGDFRHIVPLTQQPSTRAHAVLDVPPPCWCSPGVRPRTLKRSNPVKTQTYPDASQDKVGITAHEREELEGLSGVKENQHIQRNLQGLKPFELVSIIGMTSVIVSSSENGGRLQSPDTSSKEKDSFLHLSTDVSLRGPRMLTEELCDTQNALFLRTHTHTHTEMMRVDWPC